jgi:hypothetical protein
VCKELHHYTQMTKPKKALLITAIILVAIVAIIIACISPIAKYAIEKYDVKFLGREIKIGWLYLNPFTGYIHISNLRVYEADSDSLFLSAGGVSADFQMLKLFKKTYEINTITLDKPVAYIKQSGKVLNFNDLIQKFTPKEKRDTTVIKEPVHFNILNIAVNEGEFHYIEKTIPVNYFVKNVNISSTGKWWDVDSMNIKFALQSGPSSGDIKGTAALNLDNLRYRLKADIVKFDLGLLEQYLKDLANYGHLAAILDANIEGTGNFKDQLDLDAKGFIAVSDFHFGKTKGDDFASFDKLVIDAAKINPKNFKYYIDSIMIAHPFFVYERYDELNNIEQMFGKGGSRIKQANAESDAGKFNLIIEIAKYVKVIGKNFLKSYYKVGKVAIYEGDIKFNDYSLREKFSVEANPLYLVADSIDKNHNRFSATLRTGIKPYGDIAANLSMDPNDYGNFDIKYELKQVPISMFNPYVVSYTSFPLDRGKLEFNGYTNVKDSIIKSENHLLVIDPRVAKRVKKKDTKWIPVPFIMSLVRSSGNAIDFQIPIAGNLNNPKFKLWPIIGEVVRNIFVKPPSSYYLYHVKQVEQEVEKSLSLKWQIRQVELASTQEKFVNRMAEFLKSNEKASINIIAYNHAEKEKEHILLFEAKKKFYIESKKITVQNFKESDSAAVEKLSVKDTFFVRYLDKYIGDSAMFTLQSKCEYLIGKKIVNDRYNQLLQDREKIFKSYFGESASRVKFERNVSVVPFNGFSYYKIDYNGEFPKKLIEAYEELEELNQQSPRQKYTEKRRQLKPQ